MLLLTHGSPTNDAQRRLFAILHELGTGGAKRRGVAVLGDGFARFGPVAGIVCSPEAIAVVAALEASGGDGYLFAPLHGAWTIGGRPARIDQVGSNPVSEVDLALKRIVATIRRGGLDPGYTQALIALDGPVTGVAQPETERGHGIVVATTQRPDLLLEALDVATTDRSGGLSSTWTTADVTGVLETLGFDCSGLDTQLLANEGFPYSPYVLRPTSIDDTPFSRPESNPAAIRPLRSHAAGPGPVPVSTIIAGGGTAEREELQTGPIPAVTPPLPADREPAAGPESLLSDPGEEPVESRRSPWRWLVPLLVLVVVVAAAVLGAGKLFGSGDDEDDGATAPPGQSTSAGAGDSQGQLPSQEAGGFSFAPGPADSLQDCAAHAYGDVQQFLVAHPCTQLDRGLFLTEVDGKPVAISVAEITMPQASDAAALKAMTDTSGTGNLNDLLREGVVPSGYPSSEVLINGEYASAVNQTRVRIVEAAFVDGSDSTANVDAAADAALQLEL